MKVTIAQENLNHGLDLVGRAVSNRASLPVLEAVLLETAWGQLKLSATDLSLGITCQVGCQVETPGAVAIPARLLSDFVASLPNEPVVMELKPRSRTLHLSCKHYEARIKGLPQEDFPAIPTAAEDAEPIALVDPRVLREAVGQVAFAASTKDTRPAMTGVYTCIKEDQVTLVAADGFRLATRTIKLATPSEQELNAIVPARAMAELGRVLSNEQEGAVQVYLTENGNQIIFHSGSSRLVANLIEARYPDYDAIVPKGFKGRWILSTKELRKALRIASLFASSDGNIVRLEVTPADNEEETAGMTVSASTAELGSNEATLDHCQLEGEAGQIAFNVRYLQEAISALGAEQLAFEYQAADRPGVVKPVGRSDQVHVIMPMQL